LVPCGLKNRDNQIDPYVGCEHSCYYCYALNKAETDWSKEVLIYKDIAGQLSGELENVSPQTIYMGYYTDPYQPCEAEYRQTRQVLELLLEKNFSVSILTKSDLIVRDMDILREMDHASASVSVAFNDNRIRQKFEANTIDTEARIRALQKLREAGIQTSALICPVIPYITDVTPLIDMLELHTDAIWIYGLSINERSDRNWQNVQGILSNYFPNLREQIEAVIFSKDHSYWTQLRQDLKELQKDRQLNLSIHL
jgi:DNA repair photolyase